MKKKVAFALCAALMLCSMSVAVLAAEPMTEADTVSTMISAAACSAIRRLRTEGRASAFSAAGSVDAFAPVPRLIELFSDGARAFSFFAAVSSFTGAG